jgi:predicted TIM-barrel fold metal-dependent hydrolase
LRTLFDRYAPWSIAVKSQHAYDRSLRWQKRTDVEAEQALSACLKQGDAVAPELRDCLGDWAMARVAQLAAEHNLPIKLHTGYHAGWATMPLQDIWPGHLCELLKTFPDTRFVLMHAGYPFGEDLIAIAKHYPNVWIDLCWAWAINPRFTQQFLRHCLRAVPLNKLFGFGGDTFWPTMSLAFSRQARHWFTQTLEQELADGDLTEIQGMQIATALLHDNAMACFDVSRRIQSMSQTTA